MGVRACHSVLAVVGMIGIATGQAAFARQAALAVAVATSAEVAPAPLADVTPAPSKDPPVQTAATKNYGVPLSDIVIFESLLNRYGERFIDRDTYHIGFSSIARNLKSHWVLDNDPFSTNQFMHPYQGSERESF